MTSLISTQPRQLGTLTVQPLAFGCWRLVAMPAHDAQQRIEAALESDMNLIDNADVYGLDWGGDAFGAAESLLGEVLKQAPQLRDQMVLATKGGIIPGIPYDSAYLQQACDDSLRRLNTDRIDLYQIHRPDLLTHPSEVARVLETLKASGKVAEIGVSNFRPSQIDALQAHLPFKLVAHQPEYSALHLDPLFDGTFDHAMQHNMAIMAWSPLAGGRLSKTDGLNPELATTLAQLAEREDVDTPTLAIAFVLAHPANPIAIIGSTNPERIRSASRALSVSLNRADVYRIIEASMGQSLP
ncbi:MAG: putative oxidoreductase [Candidatus Azotimanducaceae bacterium]|jgi:predicted oxidoreductase